MSNGTPAGNGSGAHGRDQLWWLKAIVGTLFALLSALLLKGCDEWQKTNSAITENNKALTQLTSDVRYQIERVGVREAKLAEIEKNLQALLERTREMFAQRRDQADQIVDQVDQRLDRLEQFLEYDRAGPTARPRR